MKKTNDRSCLIYIGIVISLVIIFKAVQFLNDPNAIYQITEFFEGLGLCIGSIIILILCLYVYLQISTIINRRLILESREYSVRVDAIEMKKIRDGEDIPDNLPEESTQAPHDPISRNLILTNYGLWFKERKNRSITVSMNVDAIARANDFFTSLESSIIGIWNSKLYYVPYRREGNLEVEYGPSNLTGFNEVTPKLSKGDQLKIILVVTRFCRMDDRQKVLQLEQPMKLKLTVLTKKGADDLIAATELYNALHELIRKSNESDDDDSWMYRSRPTFW